MVAMGLVDVIKISGRKIQTNRAEYVNESQSEEKFDFRLFS